MYARSNKFIYLFPKRSIPRGFLTVVTEVGTLDEDCGGDAISFELPSKFSNTFEAILCVVRAMLECTLIRIEISEFVTKFVFCEITVNSGMTLFTVWHIKGVKLE